MRIRGSGFGFFGSGGGGGSRSDSFKRGRKPGQKVRGKLLKWVSDDMAWVDIEGHKLLAKLNSRPPVGAHLTFIIKQLHPDVMLKEVFGVPSGGVNALSLASDFEAARTLFENNLRPLSDRLDHSRPEDRLSAFTSLLSEDTTLLASFLDAVACANNINLHLDTESLGTIIYQPWLIPSGRRHITLVKSPQSTPSNLMETVIEFELGQIGMVRAEFLFKTPATSFRLKLQNISKTDELSRYLQTRRHPNLFGEIKMLGISKLPSNAHGGILAQLMFKQ